MSDVVLVMPPHPFVRGDGACGPPDETCQVCQCDPRNLVHDADSINALIARLTAQHALDRAEIERLEKLRAEMQGELVKRRASDLTEEEREALMWARRDLASMHTPYKTSDHDMYLRALAVLDKILGGKA